MGVAKRIQKIDNLGTDPGFLSLELLNLGECITDRRYHKLRQPRFHIACKNVDPSPFRLTLPLESRSVETTATKVDAHVFILLDTEDEVLLMTGFLRWA
jgi:hypothetical protein